jgi:hypothetical protein
VDQDRLPHPHGEPPHYHLVSRAPGERHGRGLLVGERGGLLGHDVGLRGVVLGVATVGVGTEDLRGVVHFLTYGEVGDTGPDLLDDARDIRAEDYRHLKPGGAAVGPKLGVYGVGSRGDHSD